MADLTLKILTWSNVERGKGKPTHRPFSTHISTIFVHGGRVFCRKYPRPERLLTTAYVKQAACRGPKRASPKSPI